MSGRRLLFDDVGRGTGTDVIDRAARGRPVSPSFSIERAKYYIIKRELVLYNIFGRRYRLGQP